MRLPTGVITRKGQITLPAEIRRALGLKQGDVVTFELEENVVKVVPTRRAIRDFYQSVPALRPSRSWKEIEAVAHEEQARSTAREDL
jgi:AbrB family looped-hinge helix DNA binding protein